METGIAKRAGTSMQQRKPSPSLSGKSEILKALTMFSLRRQAAVNPETVMPSFYTTTGLTRVGRQWQGRPVLDARQIEDVVAFLATLRDP